MTNLSINAHSANILSLIQSNALSVRSIKNLSPKQVGTHLLNLYRHRAIIPAKDMIIITARHPDGYIFAPCQSIYTIQSTNHPLNDIAMQNNEAIKIDWTITPFGAQILREYNSTSNIPRATDPYLLHYIMRHYQASPIDIKHLVNDISQIAVEKWEIIERMNKLIQDGHVKPGKALPSTSPNVLFDHTPHWITSPKRINFAHKNKILELDTQMALIYNAIHQESTPIRFDQWMEKSIEEIKKFLHNAIINACINGDIPIHRISTPMMSMPIIYIQGPANIQYN